MPGSVVSLQDSSVGGYEDDDDDEMPLLPAEGAASRQARERQRRRRVVFNMSKPCKCSLCNCLSTEASPLVDAFDSDTWGGKRPWGKYRRAVSDEGEDIAMPEGKVCLLCRNVFKLLGMQFAHGSYKKYADKVSSKTVDHDPFLQALAEWIKTHNQGGNAARRRLGLSDKQTVKQASTVLKSKEEAGCDFEAPETFFVDVERLVFEYCSFASFIDFLQARLWGSGFQKEQMMYVSKTRWFETLCSLRCAGIPAVNIY